MLLVVNVKPVLLKSALTGLPALPMRLIMLVYLISLHSPMLQSICRYPTPVIRRYQKNMYNYFSKDLEVI